VPKPRKNYFQNKRKFYGPRSNHWIKSVDVQVISSSGKNLGVLPIREAIETAKEKDLIL
jgi:translation initiation factor IF-3